MVRVASASLRFHALPRCRLTQPPKPGALITFANTPYLAGADTYPLSGLLLGDLLGVKSIQYLCALHFLLTHKRVHFRHILRWLNSRVLYRQRTFLLGRKWTLLLGANRSNDAVRPAKLTD